MTNFEKEVKEYKEIFTSNNIKLHCKHCNKLLKQCKCDLFYKLEKLKH